VWNLSSTLTSAGTSGFSTREFDIEDRFSAKNTAGGVCRPHSSLLHCMALRPHLLRLLPDRHIVRMIMELVDNCSFTITTSNGKRSRLWRLGNCVPQGSVLAPLFFNIYIYDLPHTVSRKYAYADDLAIMHTDGVW